MDETSVRRTRRSASVAVAISVVVDVLVVVVSAIGDVPRCPNGWSMIGSFFRTLVVIIALTAALAIVVSIRSIGKHPPRGRGRAGIPTAIVVVAAAAATLATWIVLHHRPMFCTD